MKSLLLLFVGILFLVDVSAQEIFDVNRIQEVKIYFKNKNWDKTLDSLKHLGTKGRIIADVKLNGRMYKDCGVRFKGNSSYNSTRKVFGKKLPLNIKSNHKVKGQKFGGKHTRLKLANGFRDPSFIREVLSYEIAAKYMPVPRANFMHVYIDDNYYGLYTSVETIDKRFLEEHFENKKGILVKCDPEYGLKLPASCPKGAMKATLSPMGKDSTCYKNTYETKSKKSDYKSLMTMTNVLKNKPNEINKHLDVDQTLWMLAFNNVLVNLDSYSGRLAHNYYLTKDKSNRWVPLIWDLNMCLGGFRYDGSKMPLDNKKMIGMSPFLHYKNPNKPLISQLLANPRYRKVYIAHIRTILADNFDNNWYQQRAKRLQSIVDNAIKNDTNHFYSYASFKDNLTQSAKAGKAQIIGITELMEGRKNFLKNHPLFQKAPPKISSTRHQKSSNQVTITCKVENATKVFVAYRYGKTGYFKKQLMKDDGNSQDFQAEDSFFGVQVEWKPNMQYYILAENEKAAQLDPVKAEWEFHEVR